MKNPIANISLNSVEDLFESAMKTDLNSGTQMVGGSDIKEIPLEELYTFKNHPFQVREDEKMDELVESITEKGVLSPAIARKRKEGGYELISGHRRKRACELAGLPSMPVIVRKLDDDEAIILMVDANIQRENILPSERAKSLKMKYDVLKRQGKRTDLTSGHNVPKLASEDIGEEEGLSGRQIKRYIRLNNLIPELLDYTDNGMLGFVQAVDVSFISEECQWWIYSVIKENKKKISTKQSACLKQAFESGILTEEIVCDTIIEKRMKERKITLTNMDLIKYFPENVSEQEIIQKVIELLEKWKEESNDDE